MSKVYRVSLNNNRCKLIFVIGDMVTIKPDFMWQLIKNGNYLPVEINIIFQDIFKGVDYTICHCNIQSVIDPYIDPKSKCPIIIWLPSDNIVQTRQTINVVYSKSQTLKIVPAKRHQFQFRNVIDAEEISY